MKQWSDNIADKIESPVKNSRTRRRLLLIATFLFCFVAATAFAQVITGDVLGTVTDTTGATVPGAKVTIKNLGTNAARTMITEGTGSYVFNLLPPGQYSLSVEAANFKSYKVKEFDLTSGNRARFDVQLTIGATTENIEVIAAAPLLQTDSSSVGDTITEKAVDDLPLNGRNITNLVTQQVGVSAGMPGNITSGARPDDRRQSSSISANGQREYLNASILDGIDNNERFYGLGGIKPSIDAIEEVRVETNAFSAEMGRAGGAAVTVLTKSGTNKFHGSLYEFFRNDIFDAKDPFSGTRAAWRQNQFGGSIGGPVRKDKTFFFFDIEKLRLSQGITSPLQKVPSDGEQGYAASLPDSVAKRIFQLYPSANRVIDGVPYYISTPTKTQNSTTLDARVDHRFGEKDAVFVRYSYNPTKSFFPPYFPAKNGVEPAGAGFIATGAFPGTNTTVAQGAQINFTHSFTQTLLMNLRVGFMRLNIDSETINKGLNSGTKLGIPNANLAADPNATGMPGFHFLDGSADLGDQIAYPIQNINNSFQMNGDVTYTRGRHNIKIGAAVIRRQVNYLQEFAAEGWFFLVSPEAMLFGGVPPVFVNRQNQYKREYLRSWEPSMYVQDDFHVNSWLTLNVGVRYDIFVPFTEANNRLTNFDLENVKLIVGGNGGVSTDYKDFAPRFGFAAKLGHGMVVRGGFGMSYYPGDYASAITLFNPPYNTPTSCSPIGGTCANGAGFLETGPPVAPTYVDPSIIYSAAAGGINLVAKQRNWRSAYLEQFNLIMQKEFGQNVLTVGYVGSLGRRQPMSGSEDANLSAPDSTGTFALTSGNVAHVYAAQMPGVSKIEYYQNERTSNYNAMQVTFERRFSKGLMFNTNYTWSHGLNNWSGYESGGAPAQWAGKPSYDYGNSDLDIRHRIAVTGTYELPWGKHLKHTAGAFLGGWGLSASGYWQSGLPFMAVDSIKPGGAFGDFQNSIRVNTVKGVAPLYSNKSIHAWVNPLAFTPAYSGSTTTFTLGNERTNQLFGPHQRQFDLSMYKTFNVTEKVGLQFRAECFNISNTPNLAAPQNDLNSDNFGKILSTTSGSSPRVWQFALKASF